MLTVRSCNISTWHRFSTFMPSRGRIYLTALLLEQLENCHFDDRSQMTASCAVLTFPIYGGRQCAISKYHFISAADFKHNYLNDRTEWQRFSSGLLPAPARKRISELMKYRCETATLLAVYCGMSWKQSCQSVHTYCSNSRRSIEYQYRTIPIFIRLVPD